MMILRVMILCVLLVGCTPIQTPPKLSELRKAQDLVDQGVVYLRTKQYEKAQAAFQVAYELGHQAEALEGLACTAFQRGDIEKAEALFFLVKRHFPEYEHVDGNIALLYQIIGQSELAEKWFQRALENNSDNYRFQNNFGVLLFDKKMRHQARSQFRKAQVLVKHDIIEENIKQVD